jgi:hypothetical protein
MIAMIARFVSGTTDARDFAEARNLRALATQSNREVGKAMGAPDTERVVEPGLIASSVLTITRGVAAGWLAGIVQVLLAQLVGLIVGRRERADVGPRFLRRASEYQGRHPSPLTSWLLSGVFHFEYAAGWGALYAAIVEGIGWRRVPPVLDAIAMGGIIYAAAFSSIGAGTQTGAERPPERRGTSEVLVHLTAAFSFAVTAAVSYRWIRARW